jgi:hypothetical protein
MKKITNILVNIGTVIIALIVTIPLYILFIIRQLYYGILDLAKGLIDVYEYEQFSHSIAKSIANLRIGLFGKLNK